MTRKVLNPVTLATAVVIIYTVMPILSVFISSYITTYAYMILVVFLLGFIMLTGGFRRMNSLIYVILPFLIYIGCTYFTKTNSLVLWGYQSMLFLMPVIIGYYYVNYRPENLNFFAKILIIAVLITTVTTIVGLIQFPSAARILATIAESNDSAAVEYWWHNIGGYDFVYTCVLLYPLLILARKSKRINKITFLVAFALLLALVVMSEYTAALLLVIITSVLYFAGRRLNTTQLLIIGVVVFVAIFMFWDVLSRLLLWIANIMRSDVLSERLTALANGFTGLESSESNRIELYQISISGFLSSPIFGGIFEGYTRSGGHSFILDTLSNYGILGGAALFFCYRNIYKVFFLPFRNEQGYGFVLWAFVQAIILSMINTGMWLSVLTLFVPMLLSWLYNTNSEETYENSLDSEYAY